MNTTRSLVVTLREKLGRKMTSLLAGNSGEEPGSNCSEICVVGRDLTEFNAIRYGSFIRSINLSFNLLNKVRGLEGCAGTLEELILDNNQLIRLELRAQFPKLNTLSLNKNRISNLTALLADLGAKTPNLRYLSLLGNPVCPDQLSDENVQETEYAAYRCHILFHLSRLRFLDHRIVSNQELAESKKLCYGNVKVVPSYTPLPASVPIEATIRNSSALTQNNSDPNAEQQTGTADPPQRRKGRQGRRKFKYVGKNSEGNRFIKDSDL